MCIITDHTEAKDTFTQLQMIGEEWTPFLNLPFSCVQMSQQSLMHLLLLAQDIINLQAGGRL